MIAASTMSATASHVDLLIIGAGPAGLMAAMWASKYDISTRIIDKARDRVQAGHADGLQPRTLEIFDSFGMADRLWKESYHEIEVCSWAPDDHGVIQRKQWVLCQRVGISRFQQAVIHQGEIERSFLDLLAQTSQIRVERNTVPEELDLDYELLESQDEYPITVKVRHPEGLPGNGTHPVNGRNDKIGNSAHQSEVDIREEVIKAKYIIGCDGAHSWTREQLGLSLEGDQTDHVWGVLDIVPLTDFPDIRQTCAIHSANAGSIMIVPREDRLVRLYVQLTELKVNGGRFDRSQVTPASILATAKRSIKPYTLDYKICHWWSVYQIGQRIAKQFSVGNRIFLAGDAVHTHSPKVGQGMNVSMQDTYNLGWKIGGVITGCAKRSILDSYQIERHQVALDLIATDHAAANFYSRKIAHGSPLANGAERETLQAFRERHQMFLSGVAVDYSRSMLTASAEGPARSLNAADSMQVLAKQYLAPMIKLGMRLPSCKVLNQAEARPVHLAELLKSDGRWRVIVFAGDLSNRKQFHRLQQLGVSLAEPTSFVHTYTRSNAAIDSVIEVLVVHSAPRHAIELLSLHEIFHPGDETLGWDYWKVFADDASYHEGYGDAYGHFGIDRNSGCIVVCRPDQHVGYIGALEDVDEIGKYFSTMLITQS